MEKKQKRFYKVGEIVWVIGEKREGKIKSINRDDLTVEVEIKYSDGGRPITHILKMWQIDKLKYKAKEKLVKNKKSVSTYVTNEKFASVIQQTADSISLHTYKLSSLYLNQKVYFSKVREDAIIPSKRDEDAGYDIYANIEAKEVEGKITHEIFLPAFETTLVPTGIATALPKSLYLNAKHERGSTGKYSISVLAGVVDSGYRGEIFIALTPLHKDVLITSEVTEVEVGENVILYPYSKAICQATIDIVPQVEIVEIPYEELKKIESQRGDTKLGQSGK